MTNTEKPNAIANLTAHKAAADRIAASITEAVSRARANGASWTEVGTALGISKQAAAQKFGKLAHPFQTAAAPVPATTTVDAWAAPATPEPARAAPVFSDDRPTPIADRIKAEREQWEQDAADAMGLAPIGQQPYEDGYDDELHRRQALYGQHAINRSGLPVNWGQPEPRTSCTGCGAGSHWAKKRGWWFYRDCLPTKKDVAMLDTHGTRNNA